jgi:hypothetical protein
MARRSHMHGGNFILMLHTVLFALDYCQSPKHSFNLCVFLSAILTCFHFWEVFAHYKTVELRIHHHCKMNHFLLVTCQITFPNISCQILSPQNADLKKNHVQYKIIHTENCTKCYNNHLQSKRIKFYEKYKINCFWFIYTLLCNITRAYVTRV